MFKSSHNGKFRDAQVKDRAGMDANESRFGGYEKELRERKSLTVPGIDGQLRIHQGWTPKARQQDVLMVIAETNGQEVTVLIHRSELEQALFYFAQGDEMIKYMAPKITPSYALRERQQRERNGDFGRVSAS